jgi:glycosyltransferase involved in cell wall biosynthesis
MRGHGQSLAGSDGGSVLVVGSDVGGIPSLIRDGENGFLFLDSDADALEGRPRQPLSDRALGFAMARIDF